MHSKLEGEVYESRVRSSLMYGSEMWQMNEVHEPTLERWLDGSLVPHINIHSERTNSTNQLSNKICHRIEVNSMRLLFHNFFPPIDGSTM